jgi:hypothetical protein
MFEEFMNDETGVVVSAELILIITIAFCAAAVGWAAISSAAVTELNDVSEMVGVVSQSYNYPGIVKRRNSPDTFHGRCSGAGFNDHADNCDCRGITFLTTCGKTQSASTTADSGPSAG